MTPVERAEYAVAEAMIDHGPDGHVDGYEIITRAAISAALDMDELARVLSTQTTCDGEPYPSELHYRLARAVVAHLTKGTNDE